MVLGTGVVIARLIDNKAETIHRKSTWLDIKAVEMATLTWVSWFNSKRILEPLGYQSPMEFEREYYQP